MALVNCPECNESVSQKASVCPHCGYPMKPEEEPLQYELKKESSSDSHGASFMRTLARIIWIGGLILAIASSIGSEDYGRYSSRTTFSWQNFFTVLGTYAIYGGLAWSVGLLFEDVHGLFQMVNTLKLVTKVERNKSNQLSNSSRAQPSQAEKAGHDRNEDALLTVTPVSEAVASVVPIPDENPEYVICPKCNQRQKANRLCCFMCGIKFSKPEA